MTQLALAKQRRYTLYSGFDNDIPVLTAIKIFQGSAIGSSSGYARQLVAGDTFLGFATHDNVDNTSGASGAVNVRVWQKGIIHRVTITGASAITDVGSTCHMSDGNVFTLSSTNNSPIGKIVAFHASDSTFDVEFEAANRRSI